MKLISQLSISLDKIPKYPGNEEFAKTGLIA